MTKRTIFLILTLTLAVIMEATAQMATPVHMTSALKILSDGEAEILFTAKIDDGWHVYSTRLGQNGPTEASFHALKMEGAQTVGDLQPRGHEISHYDQMFDMQVRYFEHTATFAQKIRFTQPQYDIDCYLEYGACNDESCIPPSQAIFQKSGTAPQPAQRESRKTTPAAEPDADAKVGAASPAQPDSDAITNGMTPADSTGIDSLKAASGDLQQPPSADDTSVHTALPSSSWPIFWGGLLAGLLAVLTPCVWPVIPMTISFFMKRNKHRSKAVGDALTYGLSIVVIYVGLGLLITLAFGANALNALSTNAAVNIFFALLLAGFAASLLGAFELTLPASWTTSIDGKSERATGLLSIFLMAFTLVLVSFSCTAPIIGFLLVTLSHHDNILSPTIGMLGFAIGLAVPFALFALFPSLLKRAPKSGQWMNTVKVTLGFIELAFAMKFLSVADLAYGWRLLDREVFLSIWIAIFGLLSAYLFGWLRLPHDKTEAAPRTTSVPQFFIGLITLAFTIYMIPGLWGAPLKAISAFTPPIYTQDFKPFATVAPTGASASTAMVAPRFHNLDEALAAAKAEQKPVMVDFTGFGCVNCRKMESAVWTDAEVADLLNSQYILVSLYVDDKTPLKTPVEVTVGGRKRTLTTVGDQWSHLQATRFGANTQPYYIILDDKGQPIAPARSYNEDIPAYIQWLRQGLDTFRQHQNQ